jgi:hypothetical protein
MHSTPRLLYTSIGVICLGFAATLYFWLEERTFAAAFGIASLGCFYLAVKAEG